ncbi:MAG: HEAT repeat domain-containing protein [Planctomycetota bacterium]|jgi:hypothetical protein
MTRWIPILVLLIFPVATVVGGEEKAPEDEKEAGLLLRIEQLVKQLGAEEWELREQATVELVRIGSKAIPSLEKAVQSEDPEIRMRAINVLKKIHEKIPFRPGSLEAAVEGGLLWLKNHQDPGGTWSCMHFMKNCKSGSCTGPGSSADYDMGVTGLALLAFLWAGNTPKRGKFKAPVGAAMKALKQQQTLDGCVGKKTADGHWIYSHAICTLALAEAVWQSEKDPALQVQAQKAVNFLIDCQNPYLGWRYGRQTGENDTSVTGWAILALQTAKDAGLNVHKQCFDGALNWFNKVTDEAYYKTGYTSKGDTGARLAAAMGKFQPTEAMTAIAVTCRHLILRAKATNRPETLGGGNLIKQNLPKWDVPAGTIDMYFWFWGTLAQAQLGRHYWKRWINPLRRALLPHQKKDGCAKGSWDPAGAWGIAGGRVYSTAINTLTLMGEQRAKRK